MKLQLIKNNNLNKENFFNKKELQEILNIYGSMVSYGEWKDYGIYMSKNIVSFEIYRKATENPLFEIIKNLNYKQNNKYQLKDSSGVIIKTSDALSSIIKVISKKKTSKYLNLVK
jgi:Protein of unknown function (DUF2794)